MTCKIANFNVLNLLRCKYDTIITGDANETYYAMSPSPATDILYITQNNPEFISGHIRVRGRNNGRYPYNFLEMIDAKFGEMEKTIEVCSGNIKEYGDNNCFIVDINPTTNPDLVEDGQILPPYNDETAREMYGTSLPETSKLLRAGARVCTVGSLMFLLLGAKNYQMCPQGVKRIGWVAITVVPNNEMRSLNIYYKYADALG
jgi:hypothetical protein